MGVEDTRLLIVVENADYRAALSDVFMPEQIDRQLSGRLSPVDIHIFKAAVAWSANVQEVAIFSCNASEKYSEMTYLNVRLMGSGVSLSAITPSRRFPFSARNSDKLKRQLTQAIAEFCPNRLVVSFQSPTVIRWAIRNNLPTIALFSDWQEPVGPRQSWRHERFVRSLNHQSVNWVGAQGISASKLLEKSGVEANKIIPWEWAQPQLLGQYLPKQMRNPTQMRNYERSVELVYVGELDEDSGMKDLLKAVTYLQHNQFTVSLQVICNTLSQTSPITPSETAWLEVQVQRYSLAESVSIWAGLAPEHMLEQVRHADVLVVPQPPSQPSSAPPLSIVLAMAACTPIVACDHPYLDDHLLHSVNAMSFPLGNSKSMAHRIERMMMHPDSYAQFSAAAHTALGQVKVPARWATLIEKWISERSDDSQWLRNHALSSGRYSSLKVERSKLQLLAKKKDESINGSVGTNSSAKTDCSSETSAKTNGLPNVGEPTTNPSGKPL